MTHLERLFTLLGLGIVPSPPLTLPDEEAFLRYAGQVTVRNVRAATLFIAAAGLAAWATDRAVFSSLPGVNDHISRLRFFTVAGAVVAYVLGRVPAIARRPLAIAMPFAAFECAAVAHGVRPLGGLDQPWFHFLYLAVLPAALINDRPPVRVATTLVFPAALTLGFSAGGGSVLDSPMLAPTLVFLAFATVSAFLLGQVIWTLLRRSFLEARTNERLSGSLAELNATLELRVRERTEELRSLASHLETAREDERTRIARELHDELGQEMTALRYALSLARRRYEENPTSVRSNLDLLEELVARSTRTASHIVSELRPRILEDLGLEAGVEWLIERTSETTGLDCRLRLAQPQVELELGLSISVFRIVQEALTNVARHARAKHVDVDVTLEAGSLRLLVRDDGVGLPARDQPRPPGSGGMGIIGMRERTLALGGTFRIESQPGAGTTVEVILPVKPRAVAAEQA
jgi:signal transduction histidine kinase